MTNLELLEKQSIDAAINLDWTNAIAINKLILKERSSDLNTWLRLGFAYLQTQKLNDAKKVYREALKIQSENQIAQENLERIKILELRGSKKTSVRLKKFDPNLFLELPGKTKTSSLVNIGQKSILAQLTVGEEVDIKPKKIKAEVRTKSNEYVGSLPDDLSKRLYLFIKAGSEYTAFIKEISLNRVFVFIREEKKGKKVLKYSSFPKNIQGNMAKVASEDDGKSTSGEEGADEDVNVEHLSEHDLDSLAESLSHEEKDYFSFDRGEDEENLEE